MSPLVVRRRPDEHAIMVAIWLLLAMGGALVFSMFVFRGCDRRVGQAVVTDDAGETAPAGTP